MTYLKGVNLGLGSTQLYRHESETGHCSMCSLSYGFILIGDDHGRNENN